MCLFDLNETPKKGFSQSLNSPWSGQKLTGRVKTTLVDGRVVFSNGTVA